MSILDDAAEQLDDDVAAINDALFPLRDEMRIRHTIAELAQEADDRLAAEACLTVMSLLWPRCAPEDCGHPDWWRTPLGQLCARSLGHHDAEAVTHSVAAAMLGIGTGQIGSLVSRGKLDRHPDGGVLRASVLRRIAGQR